MDVLTIETASLGDRTYVVTSGGVAAVIDPQRDIDRVLALLDEHGLRLAHVLETHVHNDYVTGGLALAERTGAAYHVHADEDVAFERSPIHDGDELALGEATIRAVHTPGHTPLHLSYVAEEGGEVIAFTGGSMLYGSVGRTDLIGRDVTEELTRAQYRSVRDLADQLPDEAEVRPTHGFGSFCSSGDVQGVDLSTVGEQRQQNQALRIDDEDAFVSELLAGLDDHPAYYAHMGPANRRGPGAADLSPIEEVDVTELRRRIHDGQWVVDLRDRPSFARRHLRGTVNVELADSASTYLAWLMPWDTPVTLVGETRQQVADMQRQLARVGIDRLEGQHPHGASRLPANEAATYPVADFAALARAHADDPDLWVLDARQRLERASGHLPGSHHVPLHDLLERLDEVPTDRTVWVHCESGYRASIAASLLARSGRDPVLVDDDFSQHARDHFDLTTD